MIIYIILLLKDESCFKIKCDIYLGYIYIYIYIYDLLCNY